MPLYEYRCESCGAQEEKLESISAPAEHACPQCGVDPGMRRQISVAAFNLAGGGWHAQGYANAPAGKDGATAPAPAAAPASAPSPAPGGGCAGGCGCHSAKDQ
jgi:putative FmdB family regulatory protein